MDILLSGSLEVPSLPFLHNTLKCLLLYMESMAHWSHLSCILELLVNAKLPWKGCWVGGCEKNLVTWCPHLFLSIFYWLQSAAAACSKM